MGYSFKHGWVRQPLDPRDRFLLTPQTQAAALGPYAEVPFSSVPQLDQGNLGSCGPNTAAELIIYDQLTQGLPMVGASRLFIYWFTRQLMGTTGQDSGVDNRSMSKALAGNGFPAEALWAYDDTLTAMRRKPTPDVVAAAAPNKIVDYAAVVQSLTQMKGCIAGAADGKGRPFIFGFDVFQQIQSDQAADNGILSDPSGLPIGGHDVSIVGYSDVERPGEEAGHKWPAGHFKFRNHWMNSSSQRWGDNGYGYVSYAYALSAAHAGDFWAYNSVPGSPPLPPLPPDPPLPPNPPLPPTPPATGTIADLDRSFADLKRLLATHPNKLIDATLYAEYIKASMRQKGYK